MVIISDDDWEIIRSAAASHIYYLENLDNRMSRRGLDEAESIREAMDRVQED